MRPKPAREAFARARRLAKRPLDVQQADGVFPGPSAGPNIRKSRRNPAAFPHGFGAMGRSAASLEPLAPAAMLHAPAIPLAVIAVHAAHKSVVPPAPASEPPHTRQDGETALLA